MAFYSLNFTAGYILIITLILYYVISSDMAAARSSPPLSLSLIPPNLWLFTPPFPPSTLALILLFLSLLNF